MVFQGKKILIIGSTSTVGRSVGCLLEEGNKVYYAGRQKSDFYFDLIMDHILKIKKATIEDSEIIYNFICQLAEYEKLTDDVTTTPDSLGETLFGPNSNVETLIGYVDEKPVAFALYFYNFSTFKGKRGLYLEDIFVIPEMRGNGVGKELLRRLAQIAKENNCARFEWSVLDWNEPAINFYKSLGAKPMDEWTVYRLTEKEIENLAN